MAAKPSTQILHIITASTQMDGTAVLSAADVAQIKKLTAALDRRDQQYRKGKAPKKRAAR